MICYIIFHAIFFQEINEYSINSSFFCFISYQEERWTWTWSSDPLLLLKPSLFRLCRPYYYYYYYYLKMIFKYNKHVFKKEEKLMASQLCQIYWFHFNKMIKKQKRSYYPSVVPLNLTLWISPFHFILFCYLGFVSSFMQTS